MPASAASINPSAESLVTTSRVCFSHRGVSLAVRVRELLNRLHHEWRGRTIDAMRSQELLDEAPNCARIVVAGNRGGQLTTMGVEVGRNIDKAAMLFQQI